MVPVSGSGSGKSANESERIDRQSPKAIPLLVAAFVDGSAFSAAWNEGSGDLKVATRARFKPGAPVVVEIGWPALASRVPVRARAKRRWFGGPLTLRVVDEDRAKLDYLDRLARGFVPAAASRKQLRFCVHFPVKWRRFGGMDLAEGFAEDVSAGGLRLVTRATDVAVGDCVAVRLWPEPHPTDLVVTGEVRRVERRNDGRLVLGVAFDYRESQDHRSLRGLLRGFAARGVSPNI